MYEIIQEKQCYGPEMNYRITMLIVNIFRNNKFRVLIFGHVIAVGTTIVSINFLRNGQVKLKVMAKLI